MAAYALAGELFDACVTDPPYNLVSIVKRFGGANAAAAKGNTAFMRVSKGFMSQKWDGTGIAFDPDTWRAAYDVLKPGAHLVAFGSPRTFHRMICAIEDAGFEIRDTLMWVFGTGFPKSHDVAKGIDKAAGSLEARGHGLNVAGQNVQLNQNKEFRSDHPDYVLWSPDTLEAAVWTGFGTALKPAFEPIILARKPLDGTVAGNTLKHGVGGLNIDGCRIPGTTVKWDKPRGGIWQTDATAEGSLVPSEGRYPANLLHDGSDEVIACFPDSAGQLARAKTDGTPKGNKIYGASNHGPNANPEPRGDSGSAARFFYSAKANKTDRAGSGHPTIKPLALMRWLCRLVCPPGGRILDPFAGSGSTLQAAYEEGFSSVGCEMEPEYVLDIMQRLSRLS
jgi:site-specific DNA-methyltransferase (adenine-specific)